MSPKVFGVGTVTLVLDGSSISLYIGTEQVKSISSVQIIDGRVEVSFSRNEKETVQNEEQLRLVKTVPWLSVK